MARGIFGGSPAALPSLEVLLLLLLLTLSLRDSPLLDASFGVAAAAVVSRARRSARSSLHPCRCLPMNDCANEPRRVLLLPMLFPLNETTVHDMDKITQMHIVMDMINRDREGNETFIVFQFCDQTSAE
jgi:hypothetical protein